MKKFCLVALLVLIAATVLTSCTSEGQRTLGRFSIISSRNIELTKLAEMNRCLDKTATSERSVKLLMSSKQLSDSYAMENALDDALAKIPGAIALLDAKLTYVFEKQFSKEVGGYVFEGYALIDPALISDETLSSVPPTIPVTREPHSYFFIPSEADENDFVSVSEEEFNAKLLSFAN